MFILIVIAVVAFFAWAIRQSRKEQKHLALLKADAAARKDQFYLSNLRAPRAKFVEWTSVNAQVNGRPSLIAISGDKLAVTYLSDARATRTEDELIFPVGSLVSASLEGTKATERKLVTEREPVIVHQKKSPVARALVGGALLGPVGAIAGASSGLNSKSHIRYKETKVYKDVECEGPKLLVVGTSDVRSPALRITCPSDKQTEDWFHRINALLGPRA